MTVTPEAERLELDLLRYLDHVTDEAESEQLHTRLLQDPDARRILASLLLRQQLLVEASQSDKATRQLEEVTAPATSSIRPPQRHRFTPRASRRRFWSGAAAAALIGLAATAYLLLSEDPCTARVMEWRPGPGAAEAVVHQGDQVESGRTIELPPDAHLTLRYPDGSELQCSAGARLMLGNQRDAKQVLLMCGQVRAIVAPQPQGKPFTFLTPLSKTEVLGTRLQLIAGSAQDLLILEEGSVRFVRSGDGAATRVVTGELALAGTGREPLKAAPVSRLDIASLTERVLSGVSVTAASLDPAEVFIQDMTLANKIKPTGVPPSFDWLEKPRVSEGVQIPEGWNAIALWGRIATARPGNPATNVRVQITDLCVWYFSRKDHTWHLVIQDAGAACRYESFGTQHSMMELRQETDGSITVRLPSSSENVILWPTAKGPARATIPPGDVAGVAACYFARLVVNDPNRPDDRDQARIVASCGGSFYPNTETPFKEDYSNSSEWAFGRFKQLTPEWQAVTACNVEAKVLRTSPPPLPVR